MSLPPRDQVLPAREPSPRWPARATWASRTAQFSTRSLVMTVIWRKNRPHVGLSVLKCAPWVYFRSRLGFIYAGRGYLREKNQPRKPVHMRGFYHKKGPNHFLQNAEIIDIGSFTKYTGWVRVRAPRWSRGLLEIGFFVPAVGRGVWGSGAHPVAAGRSQRRVNHKSTEPVSPPGAPC